MTDESQNQALEESLALAKQLQADEDDANREVAMLENQIENDESAHPNQEGESISSYVNQAISLQLQDMGFSKIVAEKALFFNLGKQGEPLESALAWIEQHTDDADFNEELKIVG